MSITEYASKQTNHSATALVLNFRVITKQLPKSISVYTAELHDILLRLKEISYRENTHFVIDEQLNARTLIMLSHLSCPCSVAHFFP